MDLDLHMLEFQWNIQAVSGCKCLATGPQEHWGAERTLLCGLCQCLWCSFSHCSYFLATNVKSLITEHGIGRDSTNGSREPSQAHPSTPLHPDKIFNRLQRGKTVVEPSSFLIVQETKWDSL